MSSLNARTIGIVPKSTFSLITNMYVPVSFRSTLGYFTFIPSNIIGGTPVTWSNTDFVLSRIYVEYN